MKRARQQVAMSANQARAVFADLDSYSDAVILSACFSLEAFGTWWEVERARLLREALTSDAHRARGLRSWLRRACGFFQPWRRQCRNRTI